MVPGWIEEGKMFQKGDIVRKGDRSFKVVGMTRRGAAHGWRFKGPLMRRDFGPLVHVIAGYGTKTARVLTFSGDRLKLVAAATRRAA